jgi:hypothetical protein
MEKLRRALVGGQIRPRHSTSRSVRIARRARIDCRGGLRLPERGSARFERERISLPLDDEGRPFPIAFRDQSSDHAIKESDTADGKDQLGVRNRLPRTGSEPQEERSSG